MYFYYVLKGNLKIVGNHSNPYFCAVLSNNEDELNSTARMYRSIVQEMHAYKIEVETQGNCDIKKTTKIW